MSGWFAYHSKWLELFKSYPSVSVAIWAILFAKQTTFNADFGDIYRTCVSFRGRHLLTANIKLNVFWAYVKRPANGPLMTCWATGSCYCHNRPVTLPSDSIRPVYAYLGSGTGPSTRDLPDWAPGGARRASVAPGGSKTWPLLRRFRCCPLTSAKGVRFLLHLDLCKFELIIQIRVASKMKYRRLECRESSAGSGRNAIGWAADAHVKAGPCRR